MVQQRNLSHSVESSTLADVLERVLDKGIVIAGDIRVKLVDIELLSIQIRLVICSVDKAKEMGMDWWVNNPIFRPDKQHRNRAGFSDQHRGEIGHVGSFSQQSRGARQLICSRPAYRNRAGRHRVRCRVTRAYHLFNQLLRTGWPCVSVRSAIPLLHY